MTRSLFISPYGTKWKPKMGSTTPSPTSTTTTLVIPFLMDVQMEDQSNASHEEKFRVYNAALTHAATCHATTCDAHTGRCHKVKASIDHFVRCYGPRRKISPIERYFFSILGRLRCDSKCYFRRNPPPGQLVFCML